MQKVLHWIPGIFMMAGGLYTIYYFNTILQETLQLHEQSNGLMRVFSGVLLALGGSLIVPIVTGGILVLIGAVTIWKKNFFLALISLIFVLTLFNWVGIMVCCIGSIFGMIIWRKQLH